MIHFIEYNNNNNNNDNNNKYGTKDYKLKL